MITARRRAVAPPPRAAGRPARGRGSGPPQDDGAWPRAMAAAVVAVALLTVASALTPPIPWRSQLLEAVEPSPARMLGHLGSLAGAAALLALAPGLARARRRTTGYAIGVLCLLAVANAAKGLDYEEAGLALALALALRHGSRRRPERGESRTGALAAAVALAALAGAFALEVALALIGQRSPHVATDAGMAALHLLRDGWVPAASGPATILRLLISLALATGAVAALALLRPARAAHGHTDAEHARAAAIVARWGTDTLAPFALREDKAFYFAHGGLLAYRTLRETAVVSGDPIGPPGAAPAILAGFLHHAGERGWEVVVTAASARHLAAYRALGLSALRIGGEAVVDPGGFSLEGRAVRKLRQSVTRLQRRGWSTSVVPATALTGGEVEGIRAIEQAWRAGRSRLQGWAMAMDRLWGAPEDARDLYVLARDCGGDVRAFLRFVRHGRGLSLDAMRRLDGAPNGVTEAMVAAALDRARDEGVAEVSLNFAGFAHLMAADAALGHRQRLARWALERVHGRFQLDTLVAFSEKFSPEWRARYLVHSGRRRLPLAALRVLQAEAYVRPPRQRPLAGRVAWRPLPVPTAATEVPPPAGMVG
jgi:lysyl-tRNA synthetase, class II